MEEDEVITDEEGTPVDPEDESDSPPVDEEVVPPVEDDGDRPDVDWSETGVEGDAHPQHTFTSQPTTPYYEGDIWQDGTTTYLCLNTRLTGSYDSTDWTPAVNPEPTPQVITRTRTYDEVITDYSAASLAAYEAAGAVAYAIYDDGTEQQFAWADVYDPSSPAVEAVSEAWAVASATNQYFWHRSTDPSSDGAGTGAFVTDDTQENFLAAAAQDFPDRSSSKPYMNQLINSQGTLLRSGKINLAQFTPSGTAYYDGLGNEAENIVARYWKDGAQIGADGAAHLIMSAQNISGYNEAQEKFFDLNMAAARTATAYSKSLELNASSSLGFEDSVVIPERANRAAITSPILPEAVTISIERGISHIEAFSPGLEVFLYSGHLHVLLNGTSFSLAESESRAYTVRVLDDDGTPCVFNWTFTYDSGTRTLTTSGHVVDELSGEELPIQSNGWVYVRGDVIDAFPAFTLGTSTGDIGVYSAVIGEGSATGSHALAAGNGASASGNNSFAVGKNTVASKNGSTALGVGTQSTEYGAFAAGINNQSSAWGAASFGQDSEAVHDGGLAVGLFTKTGHIGHTVVGFANDDTVTNALFTVGAGEVMGSWDVSEEGSVFNGYNLVSRADAFRVLGDGKVEAFGGFTNYDSATSTAAAYESHHSDIDSADTTRTSNVWKRLFVGRDQNDIANTLLETRYDTNGAVVTNLYSSLEVNGTPVYRGLQLVTQPNGDGDAYLQGSRMVIGQGGANSSLQFSTKNYSGSFIRAYDNGTSYGHNLLIQSGGLLILGGGGYAANRYALSDLQGKDIERTYLGSDNEVVIEAGGNTIANRRTWSFTGAGQILHNVKEIDLSTTPSSRRVRNVSVWNDVNGNPIGQIGFEHNAAGYVGAIFGSRWGTVFNQLVLMTDANGNRGVYVDAPAEWRKAIQTPQVQISDSNATTFTATPPARRVSDAGTWRLVLLITNYGMDIVRYNDTNSTVNVVHIAGTAPTVTKTAGATGVLTATYSAVRSGGVRWLFLD